MDDRIIVFADKTILSIEGVEPRGLRPVDLESLLAEKLGVPVRVIGVTGTSVELDVYGLEPEAILRDEAGLIRAVSAVEGVHATELARIASAKRAVPVDIRKPIPEPGGCQGERWRAPRDSSSS
jgi:hypothetical protein